MTKSKLTLIIDGNWLMMSRMSTLNGKYATTESMMQDLKLLMIKSINVVLRTFQTIDNIVFVADGGSWRSKVEAPSFLVRDGVEYKGNRVRGEELDWDVVFREYENFWTLLKSTGINVFKDFGIEGDDWCWFLSKELNKSQTNVLIWTKDRDLTQLVHTDKDGCFTAWWNKENGVVFQERDSDCTSFLLNPYYADNAKYENDLMKNSLKTTYINPNAVVIDKIIRGDQSDNIQPIILRNAKGNSDKKFRVSTKDIDYDLDPHDYEAVTSYIKKLLASKNYVGRVDQPYENILEHFVYNATIVCLDEASYPLNVYEKMFNHDPLTISKDTSLAEQKILAEKNNMTSILDSIF